MAAIKPRSAKPSDRQAPRAPLVKPEAPEAPRVRQARGEAVVERILAGGLEVFTESGYAATTVDRIAERTRTSKATIYRYFPDKEELFKAIVARAVRVGRPQLKAAIRPGKDIRSALIQLALKGVAMVTDPARIDLCRTYGFEIKNFEVVEELFSSTDATDDERTVETFRQMASSGLLVIDDPVRAARNFWALTVSAHFFAAFFRPHTPMSTRQVRRLVEESVDDFLRIYPPQ